MTRATAMTLTLTLSVAALAYAWWATGVKPFTAPAYVLIAVPSLAVLSTYVVLGGLSRRAGVARYYRERASGSTFKGAAPWAALLVCALLLEAVGLALGGRSHTVATLSTVSDHLLVRHWSRWLLYDLWLAVGAGPLLRLSRYLRRGSL